MKQLKTCIKDFYLTPTIPIACYTECTVEFNPIDRQFWIYTIWGCRQLARKLWTHILYNGKESKDNDTREPGQETDKYIHRVYCNRL